MLSGKKLSNGNKLEMYVLTLLSKFMPSYGSRCCRVVYSNT